MAELKNEFSWSWSRHRTFSACPRQYWLAHYGFWGGWSRDADPNVREIYIQKRLSSRAQWIGIEVHNAAEWVLEEVRSGRYPKPETVVERYRRRATQQVHDSLEGRYRFNPKRYPGFVEHYYEESTSADEWSGAIEEIARQVAGLFENKVFLRLTDVPERIREVERLEQLDVDGVRVWVSLDVLVADGQGGFVVIDWKTGAAHDADTVAAQLGIYGVYVLSRYLAVPPERLLDPPSVVQTMYVNLREGTRQVFPLERRHVEAALTVIRSSAAEMRAKLLDVDENIAVEADFPPLAEGSAACGRCRFRRTCGR